MATTTRVTGIEVVERSGRRHVTGVVTDRGRIDCEIVVIATGMYSHEIGRLAGIEVPVVPMAHQYAITRPRSPVPSTLPTMRDPDRLVYFREEVGGMIVGGYERNPDPWCPAGSIPADFNNRLLDPDWERFAPLADAGQQVVPALVDADVVQLVNGPEAFTPDGEFILGESDVAGIFVAAGFCAHGIAGAGGVGRVIAEWIVGREPPMDLWKMDVRRFGPQYASRGYCVTRTDEIYRTYYDIAYPNHERRAGRPLRTPPAYARHAELGAEFGEKSGWERVNWYASNEDAAHDVLRPRGWAGEHWSTAIVTEALATRATAALFDESSFAKLEVSGPGAGPLLRRLCANRVDKPVGSITYTSMLNPRGGIECDLTVCRLDGERYLLVTGTAFGRHDRSWIERHAPADGSVNVRDVTGAMACLGLWGPRRPRRARRRVRRRPDVPVHAGPPRHRRRRAVLGVAASPTSASSAGSSTRAPSTGWPCGTRSSIRAEARPRPRRVPSHRLAASGEGLPGLGRRHHLGDRPALGRAGLRRAIGRGLHRA